MFFEFLHHHHEAQTKGHLRTQTLEHVILKMMNELAIELRNGVVALAFIQQDDG